MSIAITSTTVLPATRTDITISTADGLTLVGELSVPVLHRPVATAVWCHPLPTAGGFMDSHVIRKAAWRLPALADLAILRFNFRGVSSPRGTSEGSFGHGDDERHDLAGALAFVGATDLPRPWLIGWSFGTEVILKHARDYADDISGVILLSPPLHRTSDEELGRWADAGIPMVALVPEFDDYLPPAEAIRRFAPAPNIRIVAAAGAKHLWVGEKHTYFVLNEITTLLNPVASPLSESWTD